MSSPTHDWSSSMDPVHLAEVRGEPGAWAPGGVLHLVLEVLAYAAEEAAESGRVGRCGVSLHQDGSVTVADDGRGTQTRVDADGQAVRKPVMGTRDIRLRGPHDPVGQDGPAAPVLPDGHPRCGMSVVSALSVRLVHLNRRREGAWTQLYEHGVPIGDLVPVAPDGTTGTTVTFWPDPALVPPLPDVDGFADLLTRWPTLAVEVVDERGPGGPQAVGTGQATPVEWTGQ